MEVPTMGVLEEVLAELKALRSEVAALNVARPEQDELLDAAGAAALLGLTKTAVETAGKRGKLPSVVMPNRRRRYRQSALLAWATSEERS
jgi:hypothetical protein